MGYISSLTPTPHRLTKPGRPPSTTVQLAKLLVWILSSWLRPADADAERKQQTVRRCERCAVWPKQWRVSRLSGEFPLLHRIHL